VVPFTIRTAQLTDLNPLTNILADSFHQHDSIGQWMYPVWRLGIYEDLRHRLRESSSRYTCLVAVSPDRAEPEKSWIKKQMNNHGAGCFPLNVDSGNHRSIATPHQEGLSHSSLDSFLIGTVELSMYTGNWWDWFTPGRPYLANLAVHHHYRRQGVAVQLLTSCEQIALGWGFQEISLHVAQNNRSARLLYRKLGYRLVGADPPWFTQLWGSPRRLFFRKLLTLPTQHLT